MYISENNKTQKFPELVFKNQEMFLFGCTKGLEKSSTPKWALILHRIAIYHLFKGMCCYSYNYINFQYLTNIKYSDII